MYISDKPCIFRWFRSRSDNWIDRSRPAHRGLNLQQRIEKRWRDQEDAENKIRLAQKINILEGRKIYIRV